MDFLEVVEIAKREAKGQATSSEIDWLYRDENYSTWVQALRSAIQDVVEQMEYQNERLERARSEVQAGLMTPNAYLVISQNYEAWSKKAHRYRLGIEQRLMEITTLHESEVTRLRTAIERHRLDSRAPHSDADHDLWSVLDV